ncbi:MAG TPA: UxaA family hydrolase, partial [Beijerinckiaceae bacterium]
MPAPRVIRLNGEDNVVIAIDLVNQGDEAYGLTARQRIHKGHKMAIAPIREGEPIKKFNQIIGFAKTHIAPGEWVHEHNVGLHDFERDYRFAEDARDDGLLPEDMRATFEGYRRASGKTGTRNYIGILTSVNCSASVARFAAAAVEKSGLLADYPGVDGVVAIVHGTGCGHAAYGEGFEVLRRTQWGYASHPNFAGVVMVGLGCEVFQIGRMKKEYGLQETDTFRTLTIQETGGTKKTVAAISEAIRDM